MAPLQISRIGREGRGLCLLSLGSLPILSLNYMCYNIVTNRNIDGGGIRGLSELIIIEELMERIRWRDKLDEVPVPADYFDLIGGTSTGGYTVVHKLFVVADTSCKRLLTF